MFTSVCESEAARKLLVCGKGASLENKASNPRHRHSQRSIASRRWITRSREPGRARPRSAAQRGFPEGINRQDAKTPKEGEKIGFCVARQTAARKFRAAGIWLRIGCPAPARVRVRVRVLTAWAPRVKPQSPSSGVWAFWRLNLRDFRVGNRARKRGARRGADRPIWVRRIRRGHRWRERTERRSFTFTFTFWEWRGDCSVAVAK